MNKLIIVGVLLAVGCKYAEIDKTSKLVGEWEQFAYQEPGEGIREISFEDIRVYAFNYYGEYYEIYLDDAVRYAWRWKSERKEHLFIEGVDWSQEYRVEFDYQFGNIEDKIIRLTRLSEFDRTEEDHYYYRWHSRVQ